MKLKLQFLIAMFIALVVYIPIAHGQANLTFSGGNGTPLSITLQNSVTYTITDSDCASGGPFFVFDEAAGNLFPGEPPVTGDIRFSINAAAPQSISGFGSAFAGGEITANDLYAFGSGSFAGAPNNSTIVLSAGTVITTDNFAGLPLSGNFTTFITNTFGVRCSSNGVANITTAATVSVSGRVMTAGGGSIMNVRLSLTDSQGNVRTAITNSSGHYQFDDVQAGETYILSATGKRYSFSQPVQVLNINEETNQVNFIANSEKRLKRVF